MLLPGTCVPPSCPLLSPQSVPNYGSVKVNAMRWSAVLVIVVAAARPAAPQYQLVREDPFAALSSTLVTQQAAACDNEFAHLRCPKGAKVNQEYLI